MLFPIIQIISRITIITGGTSVTDLDTTMVITVITSTAAADIMDTITGIAITIRTATVLVIEILPLLLVA